MKVEVCANSIASAMAAEQGGADRIELCSELAVGGITPSHGTLEMVCSRLHIPVHVLIRPRSGDFCYSEQEFEIMLRDIEICHSLGAKGIVSGCLNADGSIDVPRTRILMEAAGELSFTFHRAFDRTPDPYRALDVLDSLGGVRVLSSGQSSSAEQGLSLLERLQSISASCQFMPGGGIGPENAHLFLGKGFEAIHFSATVLPSGQQTYHGPPMNSPGLLTEGSPLVSEVSRVKAVLSRIH